MTAGTDALKAAFRDYKTTGISASGVNDPLKAEIRAGFDTLAVDIAAAAMTDLDEAVALLQPMVTEASSSATAAAGSAAVAADIAASLPACLTQEVVDAILSFISFALPAGLNWDTSNRVFIFKSGDVWQVANLSSIIQAAHGIDLNDASICIHVDRTKTSNAGTGIGTYVGDFSNAVRDIFSAFNKGNALGRPFHVHLKDGQTWLRSNGFVHNTSANQAQYAHAVTVENNGTATVTNYDDLTWAASTSYPNCYQAARSTVARVFATDLLGADGWWLPLTYYATPAALDAAGAVNGWTESGGQLYARRADGAAVTNDNCRATLRLENYELTDNDIGAIYLKGIKFIGGQDGCVHVARQTAMNVILDKCEGYGPGALYSTSLIRPVWRLRNFAGLAIDKDCRGAGCLTDIFNYHTDTGTLQMYVLSVNPTTPDGIGDPDASSSNNAWTLHESVKGILVNPDFGTVRNGSTVRCVGTSKTVILGGEIRNDDMVEDGAAAIRMGGDIAADPATAWVVDTRVLGDGVFGLRADGAGAIYKRTLRSETGGESIVGTGVVGEF